MNTLNLEQQLILASKDGYLENVKKMIKYGANVHVDDDKALRYAVENGHLEVVKYLVEECGANVHSKKNYAIRTAIKKRRLDVVKYLTDNDA